MPLNEDKDEGGEQKEMQQREATRSRLQSKNGITESQEEGQI